MARILVNFKNGVDLIQAGLDIEVVAHILKERYNEGAKAGGMDVEGLKALRGQFLSVRNFDMITMANSGVQNLDPPEWKAYKLEDFVVALLPIEEQRVKEEKERQEKLMMEKEARKEEKENRKEDRDEKFLNNGKKIPKIYIPNGLFFDATGDWVVFETALDAHETHYNLPGESMKYILSMTLKGQAGVFHQRTLACMGENPSYKNLMKKFREQFASADSAATAHLRLRAGKQGDTESIREYEARLWKLCTTAMPTAGPVVMDREVRMSFISGLRNRRLREWLTLKDPEDMTAVLRAVSLWEHAQDVAGRTTFGSELVAVMGDEVQQGSNVRMVPTKGEEDRDSLRVIVEKLSKDMTEMMTVVKEIKRNTEDNKYRIDKMDMRIDKMERKLDNMRDERSSRRDGYYSKNSGQYSRDDRSYSRDDRSPSRDRYSRSDSRDSVHFVCPKE